MAKFDLIDDRFGEPLPPSTTTTTTAMDVDRTFFRAASEDRTNELLRGKILSMTFRMKYFDIKAPRVDRHPGASDRYIHPSEERTVDEHQRVRSMPSELPPLPMPPLESTFIASDQFTLDALTFINRSMNTYPLYQYTITFHLIEYLIYLFRSDLIPLNQFFSVQIAFQPVTFQ